MFVFSLFVFCSIGSLAAMAGLLIITALFYSPVFPLNKNIVCYFKLYLFIIFYPQMQILRQSSLPSTMNTERSMEHLL